MIDEAEEQRFLESARRALSPRAEDAERVLGAVNRAIALPAAAPFGTIAPKSGTWLLAARLGGPLPRFLAVAALAGVSGAIGYGAGFRAGAHSTAPSVAAPRENLAPQASIEKEAPSHAREVPNTSDATEPATGLHPQAAPAHADAPAPSRSVATATAQKPDAGSLTEEVRTLRRVERALRNQNPRLALALLADLDKAVPSGQLGEERLAASVQARCALGYGSPSALLEEFAKRHPTSAYLTRIRQACEPRPAASPSANP